MCCQDKRGLSRLECPEMLIRPAKRLDGEIRLPGDKSISHRAAMLSAISSGETTIENFASSADCRSTLECLKALGVSMRREASTVVISGAGKMGLGRPDAELDCGNSGTTMRLLAGILAGQNFESVLTGDGSLRQRPMLRVIDPLTRMGADVGSRDGRAPLKIRGRHPLQPIEYSLPVASAQIKSCVLLAGLNADGETTVIEPVATRDHTERMLRWFGVEVRGSPHDSGRRISIGPSAELRSAGAFVVPGDISAAAFFIVAAACLPGSHVRMTDVGVNPTRSAIIELAQQLGCSINVSGENASGVEPTATIEVKGTMGAQATDEVGGEIVANLIDELPILAVLGTRLESGLRVRDAVELRVKETDRIRAVVENLRRMGAKVDEFEDGFYVGRSPLRGARVDSFGDHRIAMAFAVAGLFAEEGETEIVGSECVEVSFPGFFEVLDNAVIYK